MFRKRTENCHRGQGKLTELEKLASFITEKVGSVGFFCVIFLWTIVWLSWNTLGPVEHRFDPYPAFVLWLFISNMIQILLMPLIMVGQNLQNKHADIRAEADYELNKKAEEEVKKILNKLDKLETAVKNMRSEKKEEQTTN